MVHRLVLEVVIGNRCLVRYRVVPVRPPQSAVVGQVASSIRTRSSSGFCNPPGRRHASHRLLGEMSAWMMNHALGLLNRNKRPLEVAHDKVVAPSPGAGPHPAVALQLDVEPDFQFGPDR